MSERQVCRLLGQWRGTQRYEPMVRTDENALTRSIIALATKYGRYGYRRITALLRDAGWEVGKAVVVERRFLRAVATGANESGVELRLRERNDP